MFQGLPNKQDETLISFKSVTFNGRLNALNYTKLKEAKIYVV